MHRKEVKIINLAALLERTREYSHVTEFKKEGPIIETKRTADI